MRGIEDNIYRLIFSILFLELRNGHSDSCCGEELSDDHQTWVNSEEFSQTVSSVEFQEHTDNSINQILIYDHLESRGILTFFIGCKFGFN